MKKTANPQQTQTGATPKMKAPTFPKNNAVSAKPAKSSTTQRNFKPGYNMGPINLMGTSDIIGKPIPECLFRNNPVENVVIFTIYNEYFLSTTSAKETNTKTDGKTLMRYSDSDLEEFKVIIEERLLMAKNQYHTLLELTANKSSQGAEDTAWRGGDLGDVALLQTDKEEFSNLANRQGELIQHLQNALARIHNKTYGICRVTGQLIDKARLRAVPHATTSVEGKNILEKQSRVSNIGITSKVHSSGRSGMYQAATT